MRPCIGGFSRMQDAIALVLADLILIAGGEFANAVLEKVKIS